jgi:hypothetical protein
MSGTDRPISTRVTTYANWNECKSPNGRFRIFFNSGEGLVGASKKEKKRSEKYQYRGQLRRVSHTFGNRHHLLQRGKRPFIECAARLPKFPGASQQTNQRYNKQEL